MSIVQSGAQHRLRFNHRGGADGARQLLGVIIEQRIPGDSWVKFTFDQPSELPQSDAIIRSPLLGPASNSPVKFVVEAAPRPTVTSVAGSVPFRNRQRVLSVGGAIPNGVMMVSQVEPAWAAQALTPVIPAGGLVLKGRHTGMIATWPRDPASGPAFTGVPGSGHVPVGQLLRVRWLGTALAGVTLATATGGESAYSGQFAGGTTRLNLAPGSIVINALVGGVAIVVRDTGDGRLVGQQAVAPFARADGEVDYVAGTFSLRFSANPTAGAITTDFEHATSYLPVDIDLSWDSEAQ